MSSPEASIRASNGTGRKLTADEASAGEHLAGAGKGNSGGFRWFVFGFFVDQGV